MSKFIKIFLFKSFKFFWLLPSKIHYYFFISKNNNYLNKKDTDLDYLLVEDLDFIELNKLLGDFFFNKSKFSLEKEIKKNIIKKTYYSHVDELLTDDLRNLIKKYLSNKDFLNKISSFFGYSIKFSLFNIRLNHFNNELPEEQGPKMLHRDNDSLFGQLKFFMVLNDLNEDNDGFFYFLPNSIVPAYNFLKSDNDDNIFLSINEKKSRIKNDDVKNFYDLEDKMIKFGYDKKKILLLDTNDTYHKGGFIKKPEGIRLLVEAVYEPLYLSLSNYDSRFRGNYFYKYFKILLTGIKNRLRVSFV